LKETNPEENPILDLQRTLKSSQRQPHWVPDGSGHPPQRQRGVATSTGIAHAIHNLGALAFFQIHHGGPFSMHRGLISLRQMAFICFGFLLTGCGTIVAGRHGFGGDREPFPSATPQAVVSVTQRIFPAVVRLDVAQEIYSDGKRTLRRGIGSGVIIDDEGRILTNYHVAGRAAEIFVTLFNKERVRAKLIGDDHWTDLAIVQMDMDEIRQKKITFSHAELGESATLVPGQDVMAVGTPFGLARTMTLGVVSNNERTFYPEKESIDEYETGEFSNWIQMDTPINPGNSGGPLLDLTGKVVGINTRGGGQNLNFAIPIDTAKPVIAAILASSGPGKKGRVDRSDLGIDLRPLQDLETFYDIDINKGVLVDDVQHGSAAEIAGVRTQDILLAINGRPINVRFPEEVAPAAKMIADLPIGADVTLLIQRNLAISRNTTEPSTTRPATEKQILTLQAKTLKLQGAVGEEREFKTWGMSAREVTRAYANEALLDEARGVVVTTINPGYAASTAELTSGDVIESVDGEDVGDLDDFQRLYDASIKNREPEVLLDVQRGRGRLSAVLKITYSDDTTPATTENSR
jgi:serine protease Do